MQKRFILVSHLDGFGLSNSARALADDLGIEIVQLNRLSGLTIVIKSIFDRHIIFLTFGLTADIAASFSRSVAFVRANLPLQYSARWGRFSIFFRALHHIALMTATKVFVFDHHHLPFSSTAYTPRIVTIGNYVNRSSRVDEKDPSKSQSIRVLYVGSVAKRKRFDLLVELAQAYPEINFEAFGVDTYALAPVNLTLRGYVQDVACHFVPGDILLSCSDSEGISRAVLEALTAGIPVIARKATLTADLAAAPGVVAYSNDIDLKSRFGELLEGARGQEVLYIDVPVNYRKEAVIQLISHHLKGT